MPCERKIRKIYKNISQLTPHYRLFRPLDPSTFQAYLFFSIIRGQDALQFSKYRKVIRLHLKINNSLLVFSLKILQMLKIQKSFHTCNILHTHMPKVMARIAFDPRQVL